MPEPQARQNPYLEWLKEHRTGVIVGIVVVVAVLGVFSRLETRFRLGRESARQAIPTVVTVKITAGPQAEELVLPGTVQAYVSAPIYARTSGYLKSWSVDIGTQVKAGQELAEIETPEVDQQLNQAEADLQTAQANEDLSHSTAERWRALLKTDSVTKQEADEKNGDYASKQALTASARANLKRLQDLRGFQRIVAPFDGTITVRNVDIGQLISAASGVEMFHISDLHKLRIYVQVPQPYAPTTRVGLSATLHFSEHPDRQYPAKIVSTAEALDPAARTLLVQLEVDNSKGELFPGAYTEVHFKMPLSANTIRVPANTLLFRSNSIMVAALGADNHVDLKPVTLGRDFGTQVEIVSGLEPDATVIVNPPDSLEQGAQVQLAKAAAPSPPDKAQLK